MVGDVSGKGLKAAMNVSLIVGAIKMVTESNCSPAAILEGLNAGLHGRLQNGFATCLALALAPDGTCTSATAGHPAPFLNDREIDLPGSLPLGMLSTAEYTETVTPLRQGDLLTLYSDGLLEARGKGGELYGFARLQTLIATRPSAQKALQAAIDFGQDDDITVLTITRLPLPHTELVAHATPVLAPA
jgi:serine phosphatase RsbU (regulator of sigma subunit)